jgi:hypothetical protein
MEKREDRRVGQQAERDILFAGGRGEARDVELFIEEIGKCVCLVLDEARVD